jgi:hypothetical protein
MPVGWQAAECGPIAAIALLASAVAGFDRRSKETILQTRRRSRRETRIGY